MEAMLAWRTEREAGSLSEPALFKRDRGEGWGQRKSTEEKPGREFLVQTIPWFSARSKVWSPALGRGLRER